MAEDVKKYISEMVNIFECEESHWLMPEKFFERAKERMDKEPKFSEHLKDKLDEITRIEKLIHDIREENLMTSQNPVVSNLIAEFDDGLQDIMKIIKDAKEDPGLTSASP